MITPTYVVVFITLLLKFDTVDHCFLKTSMLIFSMWLNKTLQCVRFAYFSLSLRHKELNNVLIFEDQHIVKFFMPEAKTKVGKTYTLQGFVKPHAKNKHTGFKETMINRIKFQE